MRFRALHPEFGVEVLDHDLRADASPEEIAALRRALDEHQILLFRGGGRIAPERHLEIASWFGPPTEALNGEYVSGFDNIKTAGSMRLPYHSDFTYSDYPLPIITLHALELPKGGTSTSFASSANSWTNLNAALQAKLSACSLLHRHASTYAEDEPDFMAVHPMRFTHPRTGRPILLVTELHATRIEELPPEDSDQMLKDLFARMYAREHIYVHPWQINDFLIWDNLALQHAREKEANVSEGARIMQRVAVGGVAHLELIEIAKRQQAERERNRSGAVA